MNRSHVVRRILALGLAVSLGAASAPAEVCRVPEDYPTIQEAIDHCNPGDTIDVAPGTYLLPASQKVGDTWCSVVINKAVTLKAREIYQAVLDGQGTNTVLLFIRAAAHIEGFVLQNARYGIEQRFSPNVTWTARNLIVRDITWVAITINDKYTRIGAAVVDNVTIDNCYRGFGTNDARGFDVQNCLIMNCSVAIGTHNHSYFNFSYSVLFNNEVNYAESGYHSHISIGPGVIETDPLLVEEDVLADGYVFPYYPTCASPVIDAGDPDPSFNDVGFPLTLGTERNDIGAYGGPGAGIELTEQGKRDVLAQAGCNQPPVADADGPYTEECQGIVTAIALDGSASSDPDGDPLTYEWTSDCPGAAFDDPTSPTPTLSLESSPGCLVTCNVTLIIDDGIETATASSTVTVEDTMPPVITSLGGSPLVQEVNYPTSFEAYFSDDCGAPHTATWDFGDGGDPDVTDPATSPATASHAYAAPGIYTVTLTVIDDCGNRATDLVVVVVYDPADGFVTGGGWFIPDGDTIVEGDPLPDNSSKANFGFVVRYRRGHDTPDGNLEFQFKAGDINLHSIDMHWLVISAQHIRFKGLATINGEGEYAFKVTGRDKGEPGAGNDEFKIEVWVGDLDTENGPPTPHHRFHGVLGGGNIKIHG